MTHASHPAASSSRGNPHLTAVNHRGHHRVTHGRGRDVCRPMPLAGARVRRPSMLQKSTAHLHRKMSGSLRPPDQNHHAPPDHHPAHGVPNHERNGAAIAGASSTMNGDAFRIADPDEKPVLPERRTSSPVPDGATDAPGISAMLRGTVKFTRAFTKSTVLSDKKSSPKRRGLSVSFENSVGNSKATSVKFLKKVRERKAAGKNNLSVPTNQTVGTVQTNLSKQPTVAIQISNAEENRNAENSNIGLQNSETTQSTYDHVADTNAIPIGNANTTTGHVDGNLLAVPGTAGVAVDSSPSSSHHRKLKHWQFLKRNRRKIIEYGIHHAGILRRQRDDSHFGTRELTPAEIEERKLQEKWGRTRDDDLDIDVNDDSVMNEAIPFLPLFPAIVCFVLNVVAPGMGTILSGIFLICCGHPRIQVKEGRIVMSIIINFFVGIAQFGTITFLLVGWFWSIATGSHIIYHSIVYRKALKERRQADIATAALEAFSGEYGFTRRKEVYDLIRQENRAREQGSQNEEELIKHRLSISERERRFSTAIAKFRKELDDELSDSQQQPTTTTDSSEEISISAQTPPVDIASVL